MKVADSPPVLNGVIEGSNVVPCSVIPFAVAVMMANVCSRYGKKAAKVNEVSLKPSNATVTINGMKINAVSAHVGLETEHDIGMPMMGSARPSITALVDIHDTENVPFMNLQALYDLSFPITKEKIVPIKVEFWTDEAQTDVICSFAFEGWIGALHIDGGGGSNHMLNLRLVPKLDTKQFIDMKMGN